MSEVGPAHRFQPGKSGNPAGRPIGARQKLAIAFSQALLDDFNTNGVAVIEAVRIEDPSTYLRVVAGLLPKEITGEDGAPLLTNIQVSFVEPAAKG